MSIEKVEVKMTLKDDEGEIKLSLENLTREWTKEETEKSKFQVEEEWKKELIINSSKPNYSDVRIPSQYWGKSFKHIYAGSKVEILKLCSRDNRTISTTDVKLIYKCIQEPFWVLPPGCQINNLDEIKTRLKELIDDGRINLRDRWGALSVYPQFVKELLYDLDGNAWETGIESDKKNRGSSVNVSVYDYDIKQNLAVIQVRWCEFGYGRYKNIRKNYYLIGRNENGNAFAHPTESVLVGKKCSNYVNKALCQIWDCSEDELPYVVRNGDVAFIPCKKPTLSPLPEKVFHIGNHIVTAKTVYSYEKIEAPASIRHVKGQHATTVVKTGYYRVQKGYRASEWDFSNATRD